MEVGLVDVDSHNFPNLALMKISAYHKRKCDNVEFAFPLKHYDIIYVSKVFGNEYSGYNPLSYNADKVYFGGTGFAIDILNGKEVYHKERDNNLPNDIEHIYPDYSLYPTLTKDTAYGFLTRGCCNDCSFCIVSKKEGRCSHKVADLSEFWNGQKNIKLLDPNILACKKHIDLLQQLVDSNAYIDFTQGLDARFINEENAKLLNKIKVKMFHFAFDFMENEKAIIKGLETFKKYVKLQKNRHTCAVYVLTNYDTTFEEDLYRVNAIRNLGLKPDIRIYRKNSAPKILKYLQRWCNNLIIYNSCDFMDYVPKNDGLTIKEILKRG